nr:efflux RND transporter periplasmic adaptor subunit [uncultured Holophaga sp.]
MREPSTKPHRLRGLGLLALGLVVGIGGTWLARRPSPTPSPATPPPQEAPKKTMYQCPMHPQIIQDHPGTCPICGMDLVPMEAGGHEESGHPHSHELPEGHAGITIDPQRQQLIGLRTEAAIEAPLGGGLRATGKVTADETRVRKVNVKVEGFVEKLYVAYTGMAVTRGAPLFSYYSPEFVSAQEEYLLALKTRKALASGSLQGSGSDLLEAARRRLTLWDVPADTIHRLEETGQVQRALVLRSPIAGVVTAKNVVEGARLTPAELPFEITDLSRVWVMADIYDTELSRVKIGTPAEVSLGAYPGRSFRGRVAFIDPVMNPATRTARVRIEVPNPKGELKPEMFGDVTLETGTRKALTVPLDAVLDAGQSKVVFVALGEGHFEPRKVTVGATGGERIEITSGLKPGEEVVVRANFLVDSESRLKAALAQMQGN